jgi:hypothetical protein
MTAALGPLRKQGDVSKDSTAPTAVLPPGSSAPPTAMTSHEQGWPRGEDMTARAGLSLPPTRTLVTPYCKRTRPGRGTTRRPQVSPLHLSPSGFPPSRSVSRRPIWAGARGDNLLVSPGTPRGRNADSYLQLSCDHQ